MAENLPSGLYVDAVLRQCDLNCVPYYIIQKGNHGSGLVMVKISQLDGTAALYMQERDFMTDKLEWITVYDDPVPEGQADEYCRRAMDMDPDVWIIEFEDRSGKNPFDEKNGAENGLSEL